jgi:RNA recognition motif-containing protein
MTKRIYVGNFPLTATEGELQELFERYGKVIRVESMTDPASGRRRSFGFVEMADEGSETAITALDGLSYGGRTLKVNEARSREDRGGGGGHRRGGRGW